MLTREREETPEPDRAPDEDQASAPATAGTPWWRRFEIWFPLAVFAASRIFTVIVVLICQRSQIALPAPNGILRIMYPTDGAPGYWVAMANWDGQWYQQIADVGYPNPLPLDDLGQVDMNAWAFFPLYPMMVGALMRVTGGSFYVVGGITAVASAPLRVIPSP